MPQKEFHHGNRQPRQPSDFATHISTVNSEECRLGRDSDTNGTILGDWPRHAITNLAQLARPARQLAACCYLGNARHPISSNCTARKTSDRSNNIAGRSGFAGCIHFHFVFRFTFSRHFGLTGTFHNWSFVNEPSAAMRTVCSTPERNSQLTRPLIQSAIEFFVLSSSPNS